ncbi:ATP-dependent helicase [Saliphagus sp. GCM10025308]
MPSILDGDIDWTDAQQRVIEHQSGPIQVAACAGSGKTHTISARIAYMVSNGVPRENIVAFTFTENAAKELKVRIRDWMSKADLEDPSLGDMFVDTIHSFCQHLLHEYREETLSYDVMGDNERRAFIQNHFFDLDLHQIEPRHPNNNYRKVKWFMEDIDTLRRERIIGDAEASQDEDTQALMEAYQAYQELLDEYHFFDHQELVYRAVQMLENDREIREAVREQYQYLIVDEYQDVNNIQEDLIELLTGDDPNLCVVGDDDQSIFGWRGAQPENFINFTDRYDAEQEVLAQNFRSTEPIVDQARAVIERNNDRVEKPMETDQGGQVGDIYQCFFDTQDEEIDFILNRIEEVVGTVYEDQQGNRHTIRYGDVGILFRKKKFMERIQDGLRDRDIPYTVQGDNGLFAHPMTNFVRLAFGYVAQGDDEDFEIIDGDASNANQGDIQTVQVTEQQLRREINGIDALRDREDEIIEQLDDLQEWYEDPSSRRIEPQAELHKILSAMGINEAGETDERVAEGFDEPVMYSLGLVSELIKDFESVNEIIFPDQITDLVEFLDLSSFYGRSQVDDPTLVDAVDLTTIHGSKGQEYAAVFIPAMFTYGFPNAGQSMSRNFARYTEWIDNGVFDYGVYQDSDEALRRLFYVALTRAKKYLAVTGAESNPTYEQNHSPSQFFDELEAVDHPAVLRDPLPDPAPREVRDLPATGREIVYPTSFSDLRYYQRCPYDYKLRQVYGFAPPIDQAFGFGFGVHDLLREMHQRHTEDNNEFPISPGEIRERVQDEDRFHLRYASGQIEDNLRSAAEDMLINYAQNYREDMISAYRAEVPFEILVGEDNDDGATALVSGEIDLLEHKDPETQDVREVDVIDFKTSERPEENTTEAQENAFQVRLYGVATRSDFDPDTTEGYVHYLQQNPEEDGTLGEENERREPVDLSNTNLDQVELVVENRVNQIADREFYPQPSEEKCAECDFRNICPHAED